MELTQRRVHPSLITVKQAHNVLLLRPQRRESSVPNSVIPASNPSQPCLLLRLGHPFKLRWEVFVLLLTVWNCFYVPFAAAFLGLEAGVYLTIVQVSIEIAYLADIAISGRTSYVDEMTGEEIVDTQQILANYFWSGKLVADLLAALPYELITLLVGGKERFMGVAFLKILKLFSVGKIFTFLRVEAKKKLVLRLGQLLFIFAVYLHLIACLWFALINNAKVYIPPALYVDKHPDLYLHHEPLRQYAYSLYMSVYMLTAAEIGPRVEAERLFAGFAILSGQLFQAYMFGEIAVPPSSRKYALSYLTMSCF